jgi:DNA-binding PucR family transcriptional regulator
MVRWQDAAHSFRQADAVFDLAARGLIQRQPLIRAQDHAANLAIVGQPELMRELVASRLAPLTPLPAATRQRLSETLEAWVAQPDRPQVIADRLQIHVQTVRYRMRQLRQLFGDSLQDPHARFELAMALRAERLGVVP